MSAHTLRGSLFHKCSEYTLFAFNVYTHFIRHSFVNGLSLVNWLVLLLAPTPPFSGHPPLYVARSSIIASVASPFVVMLQAAHIGKMIVMWTHKGIWNHCPSPIFCGSTHFAEL